MMRRYFTVVGIILALLIGLGFWLKPSLQDLRESVDGNVLSYTQTRTAAGEIAPAISSVESNDFGVFVSHFVRMDELTFSCVGAYRVTVCASPD